MGKNISKLYKNKSCAQGIERSVNMDFVCGYLERVLRGLIVNCVTSTVAERSNQY